LRTGIITVRTTDGTLSRTITVTQEEQPEIILPSNIQIKPSSLYITEGATHQLSATVLPENAADKSVRWSIPSAQEKYATVSSTGIVTAIASGESRVSGYTSNMLGSTSTVYVKPATVYPKSARGNVEYFWVYKYPESTESLKVTFSSETFAESGTSIYVMDGQGNHIDGSPFTGNQLAGKTVTISGDTFKVQHSPGLHNYSSYEVTNVEASPKLEVSSTEWCAAASADNTTVEVTSNTSWTASSNADWLTVSNASGTGDGTIKLNAAANTSTSSRIGKITVSATGGDSKTITVTQAGSDGNSSFDNASTITEGQSVSVSLPSVGQKRCYKFIPTTSGNYSIETKNYVGVGVNPRIKIYNASRTSMYDNLYDNISEYNLTAGATYYIEASCMGFFAGSYTLKVIKI